MNLTRLTLFALISSLEEDLRQLVRDHLLTTAVDLQAVLTSDVVARCKDRWAKDQSEKTEPTDGVLLDYTDLADVLQALTRMKSSLPSTVSEPITRHYSAISDVVPIRNRVMHSRPLEFDDHTRVTEVCRALISTETYLWTSLRATAKKIKADPYYAASLQIHPLDSPPSLVLHNLPHADFDDTGFFGRKDELKQLFNACKSAYPVIAVIGEGGLGKSALALKTCYEFVDDPARTYEAVIWTSAKTQRLSVQEIERINTTVDSSLAAMKVATDAILPSSQGDPIETLLSYLSDFKILLVIDNLETILDQNIESLVSRVPQNSKIILTSRVGLGAYHFPIRLSSLTIRDAKLFMRRVASVWQVGSLAKGAETQIERYSSRLQHNPLFIKWFVMCVQSGRNPEDILTNQQSLLKFCMENVFENLNKPTKGVAHALLLMDGPRPLSDIQYVTEMDPTEIEAAILVLYSSNLVAIHRRAPTEGADMYSLALLARSYLTNVVPPGSSEQLRIMQRIGKLRSLKEMGDAQHGKFVYDMNFVAQRSKDDSVARGYLLESLNSLRLSYQDNALEAVERARALDPSYFEVYRVKAQIAAQMRNVVLADECYQQAMELNSSHPPLLHWYAGFLLRQREAPKKAIELLKAAAKLDETTPYIRLELLRAYLWDRDFPAAEKEIERANMLQLESRKQESQLLDMQLQFFVRRADLNKSMQQFATAKDDLLSARNLFQSSPQDRMDVVIVEHALKGRYTWSGVRGRIPRAPELDTQVELLDEWFGELERRLHAASAEPTRLSDPPEGANESRNRSRVRAMPVSTNDETIGRSEGVVHGILWEKGYGFIDGDDGHRWFFHKNHLHDSGVFDFLRPGTKVTYEIGQNQHGPCAVGVEVVLR